MKIVSMNTKTEKAPDEFETVTEPFKISPGCFNTLDIA